VRPLKTGIRTQESGAGPSESSSRG
jgi:hypothetical protein